MDLSKVQLPTAKRITLLAANSMPLSTYAGISINSAPQELSASELASSDNTLDAMELESRAKLETMLQIQGNKLIEFIETRTDKISGYSALVTEYRREGPKGTVWVQLNRVFTGTQEVSVNLSYRESEAALWKPVMMKMRQSIEILP